MQPPDPTGNPFPDQGGGPVNCETSEPIPEPTPEPEDESTE